MGSRKSWRACAVIATLALAGIGVQSASAAITPTGDATALANDVLADPGTAGTAHALIGTPLQSLFLANASSTTALAGFPTAGSSYAILTSGDPAIADAANNGDGDGRDNYGDSAGNESLRGDTDFDVSVLKVNVNVPSGANCLAVDYRFLSEEFPEFVGSPFNDAFITEIDTTNWTTSGSTLSAPNDFATDTSEEGVTINGVGPVAVSPAESSGTTYDAATGLVTTKKPITPGDHSIYLSILDQGDKIYDSATFVDNLRFFNESPSTCRPPFVAQASPPPPAPPGPPAVQPVQQPSNSFTIGSKVVFKNGHTVYTVAVPGPGTVTAGETGARASRVAVAAKKKKRRLIKSVKVVARKAGTVKLTFKPTRAGKKVLKKKGKLSAKMKITFKPTGGRAKSSFKTITIKSKAKR